MIGQAQVFFALGGNFLSATPDTEYTAEGLRRCRLTVQVSTKLNRAHLITGEQALILPSLRAHGNRRASQRSHSLSPPRTRWLSCKPRAASCPPASPQLLSEPAIVARLALATLGSRSQVDWERLIADYDRIREHIEHVVYGFDHYKPAGAAARRLPLCPILHASGCSRRRVAGLRFTVHDLPAHDLQPGQLLMMTIRSHDQFNTTVYGLSDRYRGIHDGRRVVLMNSDDISNASLKEGQLVDLISHFEGEERSGPTLRRRFYDIPRSCAATYFPEANVLVPLRSVAEKSNTPASKSVVITVEPAKTLSPAKEV